MTVGAIHPLPLGEGSETAARLAHSPIQFSNSDLTSRHSGARDDEEARASARILCGPGQAVVPSVPLEKPRGWSAKRRTSLSVKPHPLVEGRGRLSALHGGFAPSGFGRRRRPQVRASWDEAKKVKDLAPSPSPAKLLAEGS